MDNFDVVQALARTALGGSKEAISHQIERLADRLQASGSEKEAKSLRAMVSKSQRAQASEPVDLVMSGVAVDSRTLDLQKLGLRTALPVDRDSGAPLCEVVFPGRHEVLPLLDLPTLASVEGLLQEWDQRSRLASVGLPVSSSLLLFGPPGTGKTSLALYLASTLGTPAVVARLDGLISSLLGNTARNLAALFDFCNRYETVLILDEFDAVAKVRDDPNEVGEVKRVVNALLQNLDRREGLGLSIGITNHEQLLDTAIWRRFEHQIHLGMPSSEIRLEIAKTVFGNLPMASVFARIIAWSTAGQSGADVRTLSIATMKQVVLSSDYRRPIDALRLAVNSSGPRLQAEVREHFGSSDSELARTLQEASIGIGVAELGETFGKDRRTINRWLGALSDADIEGGE